MTLRNIIAALCGLIVVGPASANQQFNIYDSSGVFFDTAYYAEDVAQFARWSMNNQQMVLYFDHDALTTPGQIGSGYWVSTNPGVPDCESAALDHTGTSHLKWGLLQVAFAEDFSAMHIITGNCDGPMINGFSSR